MYLYNQILWKLAVQCRGVFWFTGKKRNFNKNNIDFSDCDNDFTSDSSSGIIQAISTLRQERRKRLRHKKNFQRCNLHCPERVIEEKRKELFDNYWKLGSRDLQRDYIRSCITVIPPHIRYPKNMDRQSFYFTINGHKVRVCKKFFILTLDISNRTINYSIFEKDRKCHLEKYCMFTCKRPRVLDSESD